MRKLRHKYDNIHKQVKHKQKELEDLKQALEQAKTDENNIENDNYMKDTGKKVSGSTLESIKNTHDFQMMLQRTYLHMRQRMQSDLIATQIKANELHESFKMKKGICEEETDKNRKAKQQRLQLQHKLQELMAHIDENHRTREERINSLQKSIRNKEEALRRRVDRVRKQQEIAEQAANENKDSNELKMQENLLAQKLWSAFLKSKMEKEMNRTHDIEEAFQKIRAATGFSDVQEIVHKFLTREQTYSQLLMAVSDNETKIDNLRRDNEVWVDKLQELQMQNNESNSNKRGGIYGPEIAQLDNKILTLSKGKDKSDEVNKKVQLVNDQVQNWCERMIQKIDQQFNENIGAFVDKSMAFKFEKIMQAVCKQLEQIIMEEEDDDRGFITAKDFMNDFATEDFLTKNVRVCPPSDLNRDYDDTKTGDYQSRIVGLDAKDEDDQEKKDAEHMRIDLDNERRKQKEEHFDFLRRKQLEEEKAKKKRL